MTITLMHTRITDPDHLDRTPYGLITQADDAIRRYPDLPACVIAALSDPNPGRKAAALEYVQARENDACASELDELLDLL